MKYKTVSLICNVVGNCLYNLQGVGEEEKENRQDSALRE